MCAEQIRHSGNFSYLFANDGDDDGNHGKNGAAMVTRKNSRHFSWSRATSENDCQSKGRFN
jgi:hypothetical protein